MPQHADLGLIGLAVMGRNLALNIADRGYSVAVYNRSGERTDGFVAGEAKESPIIGVHTLGALVQALEQPRIVVLMIKAGEAVDEQIEALVPLLDAGDIVIDGGNSQFTDTERRTIELAESGIRFIGMGISGGEEGARYGPSLMPGGNAAAWPHVKAIFTSIAAVADGEPCCEWVGPGGAGHYVKMVHNGIEYGDMQVIAEAYDIMSRGLGLDAGAMQPIFARWNTGRLDSFLIEITADIMSTVDADGEPLLDRVLDAAGQKGTGKWTVVASMDQAAPTTLVAEAVYARIVSSLVDQRAAASKILKGPRGAISDEPDVVISDLEDALYASKIVSYAQGFMLFEAASGEFGWNLDAGTIASLWRSGCIIRSRFLADITAAYRSNPELSNLLLEGFFGDALAEAEPGWRRTVGRAVAAGIPVPAYSSALAFYDGYRSRRLPANLIQAQRDSFGAHTYERIDEPRGEFFHSTWEA
jgi:6-phosphogluconate dehydrogenase